MLHNYKAVKGSTALFQKKEPVWMQTPLNYVEMINTKTSVSSIDLKIFLGIKYILSCEFNLFMEGSLGGSYYNKGMYGKHKLLKVYSITPIGIRYKFVKPEDKSKTKLGVFW